MSNFPAPTHDTLWAKALRRMHLGWSYCLRCGMPWWHVEEHVTNYDPSSGCFPLCEGCWTLLAVPVAREEYYRALLDAWAADVPVSDETRTAVLAAVASEGMTP